MRGASFTLAAASALLSVTDAATTEEWKSRSIYQVMIDRFALTDGSTTAACEDLSQHCNGTWAGLIDQLDYIQGKNASVVNQVGEPPLLPIVAQMLMLRLGT